MIDARRPVTTGSLIGSTIGVLPKVLLPAAVLSGVVTALGYCLAYLLTALGWEFLWTRMGPDSGALLQGAHDLVNLATIYLQQAAVTWMVVKRVAGERPGFFASLRRGATLTSRHAIGALGVTAATAVPFFAASVAYLLAGFGALVGLPFTIAYVVLLCGWSTSMPAAVTEGLGGLEAMRRSWRLTRGRKRTIFLCGILFYGVWLGTASVVQLVTGSPVWAPRWPYWLVHTLFAAAFAVFAAVTYARLREAREGTDAEALAELFA